MDELAVTPDLGPQELQDEYKADVDPALEHQLESAQPNEPVEAVLLLRNDVNNKPPIEVETLLKRISEEDAGEELETNYLPRMGALIVRARSSFIRQLIAQPEVEVASLNRHAHDVGM